MRDKYDRQRQRDKESHKQRDIRTDREKEADEN